MATLIILAFLTGVIVWYSTLKPKVYVPFYPDGLQMELFHIPVEIKEKPSRWRGYIQATRTVIIVAVLYLSALWYLGIQMPTPVGFYRNWLIR